MSENLKVNANSSILEFKRKHNLLVEGIANGTIENTKPIYWHSVTLKRTDPTEGLIYYLDFIILNNSPTPFTLESFMTWLNTIPNAEIKIVQGYEKSHSNNLVSYFKLNPYYNYMIDVYSIKLDDGTIQMSDWTVSEDAGSVITDNGVNKLN